MRGFWDIYQIPWNCRKQGRAA